MHGARGLRQTATARRPTSCVMPALARRESAGSRRLLTSIESFRDCIAWPERPRIARRPTPPGVLDRRAGRGEIRAETLTAPSADEVVVRALYSGISRGTEALVFQGRVPASEYQRMRAPFQAGDFPAPVKYGYASVGLVEQRPARAAATGTCSCCIRTRRATSSRRSRPRRCPTPCRRSAPCWRPTSRRRSTGCGTPGRRSAIAIAVVGGGTVGCLVAWLAGRMPGCEVELVDVNPRRESHRARARRRASPRLSAHPKTPTWSFTRAARPAGLDLALRLAGFEATIVEMSWYGDQTVPLPLGEAFHARRLTIKSSQVGSVAASQRARWDARRRMQLALTLLADPALDVADHRRERVRRAAAGDGDARRRSRRHAVPSAFVLTSCDIRANVRCCRARRRSSLIRLHALVTSIVTGACDVQRHRARPLHDCPQLHGRGVRARRSGCTAPPTSSTSSSAGPSSTPTASSWTSAARPTCCARCSAS